SVSQPSSPISFAQPANIGLPMAYAMIQPSFVRNRSDGADVWPRFSVGTRSIWIACCSTSVGLLNATAVRSSAPSTFCPRPVFCRAISAARVPNAASDAVPQSTHATAARYGCSTVPVMYAAPLMTWPMPSKPCLWLHGPPAPNAVTVVRMMSGFTRLRLSRSSDSERNTSGGRFATTTSAVATSFLTISRPSDEDGSSVMPRLLRFIVTYIAPIPSSLIGATQRSSPPPMRSMRITSAPRSARSAAQYGPAMYRPKSSTRMPSSTLVMAAAVYRGRDVGSLLSRLWFATSAGAAEDATEHTANDLTADLAADRARSLLGERLGHALPALRPPDDIAESAAGSPFGRRFRARATRTRRLRRRHGNLAAARRIVTRLAGRRRRGGRTTAQLVVRRLAVHARVVLGADRTARAHSRALLRSDCPHTTARRRDQRALHRRRNALVLQRGDESLPDAELPDDRRHVERGIRHERLGRRPDGLLVTRRIRAQGMLHAVPELAEDLVRHVVRELRAEVHADTYRSDDADHLLDALAQRRWRVVEEQMRLVEAEHQLGPVHVTDFGQVLEQLGQEPEEKARVESRFEDQLIRRQDAHDPASAEVRAHEIAELERRLAEHRLAAFPLEREQPALDGGDGRRTHEPVGRGDLFAIVGHKAEQRAEVIEIQQQQAAVVGELERDLEPARLRVVELEDPRQERRPHLAHGRPDRMAGLAVEIPEQHRTALVDVPFDVGLRHPLLHLVVRHPGHGEPGHVAFDIGQEHRHPEA